MNRKHFTPAEISEALRDLEAGVRVPEVCRRLGVSELTLSRWRHKAGLLRRPDRPVTPVVLDAEQAANRISGLERRLEAFRLVLITMLEPPELERAARLLEVGLSVSARRARQLLGLPSHHGLEPALAGLDREGTGLTPPLLRRLGVEDA
jgi:transposase-like protein